MKDWIPLLLLAGAVVGDTSDKPADKDPLRQVREQMLEQDTIRHARIYASYLYAGDPQTGTFTVIPFAEPWGTRVMLLSSDGKNHISLLFEDGEPSIGAGKDGKYVIIPLFALAEHLGIQPEGKGDEQKKDDQGDDRTTP